MRTHPADTVLIRKPSWNTSKSWTNRLPVSLIL